MSSAAAPVNIAINFDKGPITLKKYGVVFDTKVDLLCVSNAGDYKEPVHEQIVEHVNFLQDWSEKIAFPQTRSAKIENIAKTGGTLSAYLAPNLPFGSDKMKTLGKYIMWLTVMDDLLDEKMMEVATTTTYEALSKDLNVFVNVLNGKTNGKSPPPQTSTISFYKEINFFLQDIHNSFVKHVKAFADEKNRIHFIEKVNSFLHSFLWRFGRPNLAHTSERTYLHFRRHHSSSLVIFETIALLNDIKWEDFKINRKDVEFQNWVENYANSLSMTNDIMSLRKEMTADETENLAIHKYVNLDMDINEALKATVQFSNSETNEMRTYGKRLLARNVGNTDLQTLIDISNLTLDGHLHWYGYSLRYGKIVAKPRRITEKEYNNIALTGVRKTSVIQQIY